jgi:hypothetical protein
MEFERRERQKGRKKDYKIKDRRWCPTLYRVTGGGVRALDAT